MNQTNLRTLSPEKTPGLTQIASLLQVPGSLMGALNPIVNGKTLSKALTTLSAFSGK